MHRTTKEILDMTLERVKHLRPNSPEWADVFCMRDNTLAVRSA